MQERIRHEYQTPMFLNGFSVAHAVLVHAQMAFTILIKSFDRPTLQIQGDNPLGTPVRPIGYQEGGGAGQLSIGKADDQPDFPESTNAYGSRKRPVGFVPYGDRSVRGGRD